MHLLWRSGIWSNRPVPSDYRFSEAVNVRFLGAFLVLIGLVVLGMALLVAVLELPGAVLTVTVVAAVLLVVASAFFLSRMAVLVRLDDIGYQVRYLRKAGVRSARWVDLEDVVTGFASGHPVVVLRLRDGRTTTIPVNLLQGSADDFAKDVAAHAKGGNKRR